ncbi:hypothetical protein L3Q82_022618 [Scortum barcoo]|uniref:Uncharacterized protein n=1 Tax=Scortum barcoo TaxID=214431 RepID=A0ACB8X164_9TELE|nr:hypothetical protein L3Q82_022618 [Scortum barcoo]
MDCLLINGYGIRTAAVGFPASLGSKMEDKEAAREDACREYQSSLEDLTFNSKPHINMLTILAEENLNFAKDIVAIIEAQISKAPSTEKLPVLYLVDSIVKNVGGEYLAVFAKNLITSFICVFEKVDENTRKSLFKLRSTWDDVFPLKKLYDLDVRVNSVDPAWPIKPLPPTVNTAVRVNPSIHFNPKFLKQSEEASPTQPAPVQPSAAVSQSSLTQEQLIRQQLLAKQKQLLELQQKKIELELEQTKAQLAGGFVMPTPTPVSTPAAPSAPLKPVSQTAPVVRPWIPPQTQADAKPSARDPRLNRNGPPAASQSKEQPAGKKADTTTTRSPAVTPEKPTRPDKTRTQRKEALEEKSKSPSPMAKSVQSKNKPVEADTQKSSDGTKKDPRLRKRTQDKSGEAKDDELKEKKRCPEKKEREEVVRGAEPQRFNKGKLVNGSVTKHDREEAADRPELKTGGNARTHARKRTRSRSRSRSPAASPKRKDRRSPKSRARSSSLSPSPSHKPGKPRRVRPDELEHAKPGREDRLVPKKNQSESRRSKRPVEDRHAESRDSHSPRSHDGGSKETKEPPHRWRSGWEENKHLKLPEDSHGKPGPQRHKPYGTPNRPTTPRTPKHRLSVDANLQIPEVLNSASKKDLLRRASKRLESGEISEEAFLNMAHQIKHFFQYQEEMQQQSESWDDPSSFPAKKQPLLTTPPSGQQRPHDGMDAAELSYYEHKSKLRKTQVSHRAAGEEWEGEESPEENEQGGQGEKTGGGRSAGHLPSHKYSRATRDRPGERRSKEREDPLPPLGPMIEEYNHGKEFPTLKSLPGLRFRRRADPRESSEREWNSPLTERQRYDDREEQKSGYDAPRRYGPPADPRHPDLRRPEGPPPSGTVVHRNCPSPAALDAPPPQFESAKRLSPLHQKDSSEASPIPRFESPNSEHSDGHGPLGPLLYHRPLPPNPSSKAPPHGGWYEGSGLGRYDDSSRFDGPHHPVPDRFDGGRPPHHKLPERFDGPHMSHGSLRDGMGRFDGPPHPQGPGRFDGPSGQQPPGRFEGQGPGPGHYEGPMQRFNNMAPGSGPMGFQQQRPLRFDGPNQMGPMRFEGPGPMRFDGPGQPGPRFDLPNVPQQGGPPLYDCPPGQQGPNFNMAPQRFPEPMNPQYGGGPMAFPTQPNLQPAGNFNMQPAPPFSQPGPAPFYNPAAPTIGIQQPVNMMANQPFLPPSSVPFRQNPPENHFGQVDVNDLLSKLISNGIIKPSQPDATPAIGAESSSAAAAAPPVEEEEEEEQEPEVEDEDLPDLTSFSIDDMKQRYESVVTKLYSGNQCCLCSMRFTAAQTDMYADHLDWHFRQNHAGKVASKKVTHRRWYYSPSGKDLKLKDWIEFEEIADLEERAKSQFFEKENEEEVQKNQAAAKEKEFQSVRATKDQVGELCEICQEPFETYWVEEEEDWFLKNAIRVDDKNFHPSCFEDYKNTSYIDATPSPNKLLTNHPLSTFIKEQEEVEDTSCAVKQKVASEAVELPEVEEEVLRDEVQSDENKQ